MKQILAILLLLPLACLARNEVEFDTIKSFSKSEMEITAIVKELRLALIDLRLAEKENDPSTMFNACLNIGKLYFREGFYSGALKYFQRAAALAEKAGKANDLLRVQTLVAETFLENRQPKEAHDAFLPVLKKHELANSYEPVIQTLQQLADASMTMRQFPKAKEYYLKIKGMAEAKGDRISVVTALNNLGYAADQMQDFKAASGYFTEAESVASKAGITPPGYIYTNAGIAWNNLGETNKAVQNLQRAEQTGGGGVEKSYVQHLIASIYLKNKDIYNALRYNELAVKSSQNSKHAATLCDAYDVGSQIYQQLFEYDKALDFYKKHLALKDSIVREERLRQQELDNLSALLERSESNLIQDLADQELEKLALNEMELKATAATLEADKQRLTAERQEKELALEIQKGEVTQARLRTTELEADRTRQALLLATQQSLADQRKREILDLSRQSQLDSLNASKQAAVQEYQISQLESQKQMNELELKQRQEQLQSAYRMGAGLGAILLLIFGSWLYARRLNKKLAEQNRQIESQKQEIDAERSRAEGLLLNILPGEVAQELKDKGAATPRHYDSVTVLFTDFQGFTKISSTMPPAEVVRELNECFLAFDEIAGRYRLEKIKTMGDSFMCAGGLPVANSTHSTDAVSAALEMLEVVRERNIAKQAQGKLPWPIRIGIHTGEVVAGVVGSKKFAYDIWGDTVNVASRMENNCPPGNVNISEATFRLVNQSFNCSHRGEVEVKNKGMMGMYLVNGAG